MVNIPIKIIACYRLLFIDCRCFRQWEVVGTVQQRLKFIGNFQPITNAVATASFLVVFINALKNKKAVFFCKNTRKTAKVKINVILLLLRNSIFPNKLHFIPSQENVERASRDVFSKVPFFFAKIQKIRPK